MSALQESAPANGAARRGRRRSSIAPVAGGLIVKTFHEEANLEQTYDVALLRRLWPFMRRHGLLLILALVLMPISSIASLFQPLLIKRAIDAAVVQHSGAALMTTVSMFGALVVFEFFVRFGQIYTMQLAGQRAMADLRSATFRKVQSLPVGYFDRTPVGRVVTRVTNDVDSLIEVFGAGAITAIGDLVMLVGIVCFMLALDWRLALVAFTALPPLAIVIAIFRRFAREAFRAIRARIAQLNAYMAEQVAGIAIVQAFGREARCMAEFEQINDAHREANRKSIKFDALLYSVVESVATACVAILLWYASVRAGGLDARASAVYIGTVVAFYEYINRFFIPIRDLSTKYTIIQSALASAERIFSLLDVDEIDCPPRPATGRGDGAFAIELRDVTFGYRKDHPVLFDVSFRVRPGETIAVVGATGSGKTTTTSLLLRLYDHDAGDVFVGGVDVRSLGRAELRRKFAVVPQDVFLFAGSILENVALGDPAPDRARARLCLEQVAAWDLVESRPGGLDAPVEERGGNFSAGERQLLAFARALYRDPPYLILDEATANIDSESEARLQQAVATLLHGRTAIVIAHRLSTIRNADRVLVFHRGRVAEQGTHEELLALGGIYAKLHELQFTTPEPTTTAAPEQVDAPA